MLGHKCDIEIMKDTQYHFLMCEMHNAFLNILHNVDQLMMSQVYIELCSWGSS